MRIGRFAWVLSGATALLAVGAACVQSTDGGPPPAADASVPSDAGGADAAAPPDTSIPDTQPPSADAAQTFTVGGTVRGLVGSLTLKDNGADALVLTANGSFTFPTRIAGGGAYAVTVSGQPAGQTCLAGNRSGHLTANVTDVLVICAATGVLDPTFADGGVTARPGWAGGNNNLRNVGAASSGGGMPITNEGHTFESIGHVTLGGPPLAVDTQGRVLVAGSTVDAASGATVATVSRFAADGTLDATFGTAGVVSLSNAAGAAGLSTTGVAKPFDQATSLALDAQGRVVVVGNSLYAGQGDVAPEIVGALVVWRLTTAGQVDATFNPGPGSNFGAPGTVVLTGLHAMDGSNAGFALGHAVTIDAAGNILVAGTSARYQLVSNSVGANRSMFVVRVTPAGTPDPTFGNRTSSALNAPGSATAKYFSFASQIYADGWAGWDGAFGITVDAQGHVFVVGYAEADDTFGGPDQMAVWKLLPDGSALDATFGNSQTFQTVVLGGQKAMSMGAPGVFLQSGTAIANSGVDAGAAKPNDLGFGIALDSQGRILVTGSSCVPDSTNSARLAVWRVKADGTGLDPTFNAAGVLPGVFGGAYPANATVPDDSAGSSVVVTTNPQDGSPRIVVVGEMVSNESPWTKQGFVQALKGDGTPDTSFAPLGRIFLPSAAGRSPAYDRAHAIAENPLGQYVVVGNSGGLVVTDGGAVGDGYNLQNNLSVYRITP